MTLQQMVEALNRYWSERGCLIQQPYDIEVGAGTFNPATSLRCLGPEPFNVAYVEPSRRPTDGRYGENPYKIGHYYQYQVILKPAPADSQDLYLGSLEALGLDLRANDIRFVEDDWESPTLGASGLGWEVWCNGAEVTQYTYFQQMGSIELDPICTELTYGLERVAMYLQDVNSIFDVQWNDDLKYRDVHHQTEVEYTAYYLERADADLLFRWFADYEQECRACAEAGLVWPALDYVLKASHAFNMLDARGAISVTERVGYIARVRRLARRVANVYVNKREKMGFPLKNAVSIPTPPKPAPIQPAPEPTAERQDLLFEIGTEEIPASYIEPALNQMRQSVSEWLSESRLAHGEISTLATPRRLTLHVADLATAQEDIETEVSGPPKSAAYDADGAPTRAAEGFARGQGVPVESLGVQETAKGEYVFARKTVEGQRAGDLLAAFLPELVSGLRFPKSMRWDGLRFARPIRRLAAVFGGDIVDFQYDRLRSGRTTRGHRFLSDGEIELTNADLSGYKRKLKDSRVMVDQTERRAMIRAEVERVLAEEGSPAMIDEGLLDEVLYLVEYPELIAGSFREELLSMPQEALVTAMKKDQRYFAVYNADGSLQPKFITISNGTVGDKSNVRYGNERVLRARLENAGFFWQEDLKTPLGERVESLKRVTFQESLGSLYKKTERVRALVEWIGGELGFEEREVADSRRAAELCKADLTTQMVFEFAELQGVMGKRYALEAGESEAAANAIEEHYLPLSAESALPTTRVGAALSVADKIDTIVGYFGIGRTPTGSQDPYSLRRQAIGVCRMMLDGGVRLSLRELIDRAARQFDADSPADEVMAFFAARLDVILQARGYAYDAVDAVLAAGFSKVSDLRARLDALTAFRESEPFEEAYPAFNRLLRILPKDTTFGKPDPTLFREDAERALLDAYQSADGATSSVDCAVALSKLAELAPAINRFFDDVLVMDDDEAIRDNRFALLNLIARDLLRVADFTRLVVTGDR